jgi:hypothetical protein
MLADNIARRVVRKVWAMLSVIPPALRPVLIVVPGLRLREEASAVCALSPLSAISLAAPEKINSSCVSRVLRLILLAPVIVEAILGGRQPEGMTLPRLMEGVAVEWGQQQDPRW